MDCAEPPVRKSALRTIRPDLPESVEALVLKLLAKSPEERAHPDEVYDTLLPHARAGTESTLRGELDLTLPFTRPMAASPRRAAPLPVPAAAGPTSMSSAEADAVMAQAADLAEAGQFSQATDVLAAAIARCAAGDILADELRFRLANVLFLAGSYRSALAEFEAAGNRFAEHYGPDDNAPWNAATTRRPARRRSGRTLKRSPRSARSSPTGQRQPVMGTNAHSMSAARSACCWPASATTTKPSCP